jgi:site-specific recombinase XerD
VRGYGHLHLRGKTWHLAYSEHGTRRNVSLKTTSKMKAEELRRQIIHRIAAEALTGDATSARIAEAAHRDLNEFVTDWADALKRERCSPTHVYTSALRVRQVFEKAAILRTGQFNYDAIMAGIDAHADWSDQSRKHAFAQCRTFGNFLIRVKAMQHNPLAKMPPPAVLTLKHPRRAPSDDEYAGLLRVAATRALNHKRHPNSISCDDRWWLYKLATITGFRKAELLSLRKESFEFSCVGTRNYCYARLLAADSKDGIEVRQRLPTDAVLLTALRTWLDTKTIGEHVFAVPKWMNLHRVFKTDCKRAGIPSPNARGEFVDFHSLRHYFVTSIVRSGADIETVRRLARHKDITTTQKYMHSTDQEQQDALDRTFGAKNGSST